MENFFINGGSAIGFCYIDGIRSKGKKGSGLEKSP